MAPEKHALLSASSAARWLACTPSARLEAAVPNPGTKFTREGQLAHALCELRLRNYFTVMNKRTFNAQLKKLKADELYTPDMDRHSDSYFDFVRDLALSFPSPPTAAIEDPVDLSRWVPESFGTADLVLLSGDILHIVDFKYGQGHAVRAEHNPQLMLYALGAYEKYSMFYQPETIRMSIFQPRIRETAETWETTRTELLRWAEEVVRPAAALAFAGEGEPVPGDHCLFCRVKGQCRAYSAPHISAAEDFSKLEEPKKPALLDDAEIAHALTIAEPFAAWLSAVKDFALGAVLEGREIPGWKAVEGRSLRRFTDVDAAFDALKASGVAEEILYERVPLSLAKLEKAIGKADFQAAAGSFIEKPPGKPALAPESDPRPAYNSAAADFQPLT